MLKKCTGPNCNNWVDTRESTIAAFGIKLENPRPLCPHCLRLARRYINWARRKQWVIERSSLVGRR